MTGTTIRSAVRDLAGVSSTYPELSDTHVDRYVDEAMLMAAYEAAPMALRVSYSQTSSSGTHTYAAYTSVVVFVTAVKANGKACQLIDEDNLDVIAPAWESAATSAVQTHAIITGQSSGILQVRLWPTPNYTTANAVIIRSIKQPTSLATVATGEVDEFPDFLHHGFVKYAAYRHLLCQAEEADQSKLAAYKADWDASKALYVALEQDNNSVQSRRAQSQRSVRA